MNEIADLIPHRPPMQWLKALTVAEEKLAVATACFAATDFPVVAGRVLEPALVECMAQTVAAALGARKRAGHEREQQAGLGMLVAVSGFKIHFRPAPGQVLQITMRERRRLGPMLMVSGTIHCGDQLAAEGDLSVYA